MALIPCPNCGHDVSDQADTCPNCAYPLALDRAQPIPATATVPGPETPNSHGIYRCVSGAKIPEGQQIPGQPCPFCGRTLSLNPTIAGDTARRFTQGRRVALLVAGLIVVGLVAPVVTVIRDPDFTAVLEELSEAGTGSTTLLEDLEVGDCWTSEDAAVAGQVGEVVELNTVGVVACDESHHGEVFSNQTIDAGPSEPFPGDLKVSAQAQRLCIDEFEATFGSTYESSPLAVHMMFPLETGWRRGDRAVSCSAVMFYVDPFAVPAAEVDERLPGSDLPIAAATSCDEITDLVMINAQLVIEILGGLTPQQWAALDTSGAVPEFERVLKRDELMSLRAEALGCGPGDLNREFAARVDELEADTIDEQQVLDDLAALGYWDESLAP